MPLFCSRIPNGTVDLVEEKPQPFPTRKVVCLMSGPSRMIFIYDTTSFDTPVWVTFWSYYMYGPCETLEEVLQDIYLHWEDDRFIVG